MLIIGGASALTAALGMASTHQFSAFNPSYQVWERMMLLSLGVSAASLPLYVAAYSNKRRAATFSLQAGAAPGPWIAGSVPALYPVVGVGVRF